jgi:CheY-like chemotaxis protein
VAEDRAITRAVLEKSDFHVEEAGNWKEAMNKINACKIDVVLLDIQMPDVSGLELLELIRKEKSKESLPVIIYSSKVIDSEGCLKVGANACLSKGAEVQEMIDMIKKVFSS